MRMIMRESGTLTSVNNMNSNRREKGMMNGSGRQKKQTQFYQDQAEGEDEGRGGGRGGGGRGGEVPPPEEDRTDIRTTSTVPVSGGVPPLLLPMPVAGLASEKRPAPPCYYAWDPEGAARAIARDEKAITDGK
jgi:hypothetical protein